MNAQDFAQSTDPGSDGPRSIPKASTATQALPAIDTDRCRTNLEGGHSGESIGLDTCRWMQKTMLGDQMKFTAGLTDRMVGSERSS